MTPWIKFGCILTGWDSKTLAQCSEASRSQLSKYTSALVILIMIWSVTGFCFAQRYMELPIWACSIVSMFFVTIVIMVERQIILTRGKSWKLLLFRFAIAGVMAVIGSTIFDQTMFGKDIDKQMTINIEKQVEVVTAQRVTTVEQKLASLHNQIDSISTLNAVLQADIAKNPFVTQTTSSTGQQAVVVDGVIKKVNTPSVTKTQVENPKQALLTANNAQLDNLLKSEQQWTEKKQTMEEEVRKECMANVGFLEELQAMYQIVTGSKLALMFYIVFFSLLMCLELFVVVSKIGDKECDYDLAIAGAERVRMMQFNKAFGTVR